MQMIGCLVANCINNPDDASMNHATYRLAKGYELVITIEPKNNQHLLTATPYGPFGEQVERHETAFAGRTKAEAIKTRTQVRRWMAGTAKRHAA